MKITMHVDLNTDEVIEGLIGLPDDKIVQFVKDLDMRNAMWNFTIDMFRYFASEVYNGDSDIIDEMGGLTFDDMIEEIKRGS